MGIEKLQSPKNMVAELLLSEKAGANASRWTSPNALRGYQHSSVTLIGSGDFGLFVTFPSKGFVGFIRTLGSFTFLIITRRPSIAAPWGLEPEKELEQTFPMQAHSLPHDQYRGNAITALLTYFQAPIEAFRGHSQESRGGDTVTPPRWEKLFSLASQRRPSSIHGTPRVVVFIFWPSGRKTGFLPLSFFRG